MSLLLRGALSAALLIAAQPVFGQGPRTPMPGEQVKLRTTELMQKIEWGTTRAELQEKAQESGKLVFWLQFVGKLDDGL